jgi:hypothetical protein
MDASWGCRAGVGLFVDVGAVVCVVSGGGNCPGWTMRIRWLKGLEGWGYASSIAGPSAAYLAKCRELLRSG